MKPLWRRSLQAAGALVILLAVGTYANAMRYPFQNPNAVPER